MDGDGKSDQPNSDRHTRAYDQRIGYRRTVCCILTNRLPKKGDV
jgi:hypothetical protein